MFFPTVTFLSRRLIALAALYLAGAAGTRADIYLDNLSAAIDGTPNFSAGEALLVPFTTDNSALRFQVNSVTFCLFADRNIFVRSYLYSSSGGTPDAPLAIGTGSSDPVDLGNYTYTFSSTTLQPDTLYFVGIVELSGLGGVGWGYSSTTPADLGSWVSNTSIAQTTVDSGATWASVDNSYYPIFQVAATPVPEPADFARGAGLVALGCVALTRRKGRVERPRST